MFLSSGKTSPRRTFLAIYWVRRSSFGMLVERRLLDHLSSFAQVLAMEKDYQVKLTLFSLTPKGLHCKPHSGIGILEKHVSFLEKPSIISWWCLMHLWVKRHCLFWTFPQRPHRSSSINTDPKSLIFMPSKISSKS